jgi:hypothetical protein
MSRRSCWGAPPGDMFRLRADVDVRRPHRRVARPPVAHAAGRAVNRCGNVRAASDGRVDQARESTAGRSPIGHRVPITCR